MREGRTKRISGAAWILATATVCALAGASARGEETGLPADAAGTTGLEGWIEGVVGEPVAGGQVAVAGWAADRARGTPVYRVEMMLDGRPAGYATVGIPREDVARVAGRPDWGKAGWTAVIVLQGVGPGKHRISAIAQSASGERQSLHGDKQIVVKEASAAPAPAAPAPAAPAH